MKYKSGDKKTTAKRTDDIKLDENNNINFFNLIIEFEDINKNDDSIAVYLEYQKDEKDEFKKIEIKNGKKKYHIIKLREININNPALLSFNIVDNISLTINLTIKKAYGHSKGKSFYQKLNAFNTNKKMDEIVKNNNIPKATQKKLKIHL